MKKILIISALILPLWLGACQPKNNAGENSSSTEEQTTDNSGNPYVSNQQDGEATLIEEDLSGKVITLSASDFIERICDVDNPKGFAYKGLTPCLVDFYAGWCGPCMKLKPTVEALAKEYKGKLIVYTINVDRAQDICEAFGIESIPTLLFFSRTKQPMRVVGYMEKQELKTAIDNYLSE